MIVAGLGAFAGRVELVEDERAHVYDRMRTMLAEWRSSRPIGTLTMSTFRVGDRDYPISGDLLTPSRWIVSADVDVLIRTTFTTTPALGPVIVYGVPVGVDSMLPNRSIMLEDGL